MGGWVGERAGRSGSDVIRDGMITKGGICGTGRSYKRCCSPTWTGGDHGELEEDGSGKSRVKNFNSALIKVPLCFVSLH